MLLWFFHNLHLDENVIWPYDFKIMKRYKLQIKILY
jgi:hypothetical protein